MSSTATTSHHTQILSQSLKLALAVTSMYTGANTSSILQQAVAQAGPRSRLACSLFKMANISDGPISVTVLRFKVSIHEGSPLSPLLFLVVIKACLF